MWVEFCEVENPDKNWKWDKIVLSGIEILWVLERVLWEELRVKVNRYMQYLHKRSEQKGQENPGRVQV